MYRLADGVLHVKSVNIQGPKDEISYQITEDGVTWIH